MRQVFLGIDNGFSGCLAVIDGADVSLHDAPTLKAKTRQEYVVQDMVTLLLPYSRYADVPVQAFATIEAISGRPDEGVTSARRTGQGHGLWVGILAALGIPYQLAYPAAWKREFALIGQDKSGSVLRALELFPGAAAALRQGKTAKPLALTNDQVGGRAESLLLAEWGRRRVSSK